MGFLDPLDARTTLYRRAKLLYDFNAASDPISISQAALILTYYSTDREPLGLLANTNWLRIAIQNATMEKVHMYGQDPELSPEERLCRKRLWWYVLLEHPSDTSTNCVQRCCILRDRIMPLGVRRPIQITRDNFDFTQEPISEEDLESESEFSQVYDTDTKRTLARIFISQVDLAIALTDLLSLIYPMNSVKSLDFNTLMCIPSAMQRCRNDLEKWSVTHAGLPTIGIMSTRHKSVSLFNGLTQIYYQTARAALCQYESLALQANSEKCYVRTKELGSELHSAIASISTIVSKLVEIDVARYFPVST